MNYDTVPEFEKDLKKLKKKYKTLDGDLEVFKKALKVYPRNLTGVVRISSLGEKIKTEIYKARKFYCKSLKGKGSKSGIRVVYAYVPEEDKENKIILIEIYHKGKKSNHDIKRIEKYF